MTAAPATLPAIIRALGHIAFRMRNIGTLNRQRLVVALIALALIPVAMEVDALITVVLLATLLSALILYEVIHFREARGRVRAAAHTG